MAQTRWIGAALGYRTDAHEGLCYGDGAEHTGAAAASATECADATPPVASGSAPPGWCFFQEVGAPGGLVNNPG